jgi:glycosyltransferase 2 family protein
LDPGSETVGAGGRARIGWLMAIGAGIGLGLAVWLVASNDVGTVMAAFARVGWPGLAAVVLIRVVILSLCGLGWARLLDGLSPVPTRIFVRLRWVRESINVLLPVASVGGDVLGGRLVTFWGVGGSLAAASIMVDLLIQAGTQALFAVTGVVLVARLDGGEAASIAAWCGRALAVSAVLLGAFFAVQRLGLISRLERAVAGAIRRWPGGAARSDEAATLGVQAALDAIWGRGRGGRLVEGVLLHLLAWFAGVAEIAIALWAMGFPVGLAECVVIESLAQALRSAAFPVPGGLGVQEGGFVILGGLYGIDPGSALALSLVKRVPDLVLGIPGLAVWQAIEARRLRGGRFAA